MAFTKKIYLYSVRHGCREYAPQSVGTDADAQSAYQFPAKGAAPPTESEKTAVWADVSQPGVTTQYTAQSAGKRAELQVKMRRAEYEKQTHALIDGGRYHIEDSGATDNPFIIRLVLAKGG